MENRINICYRLFLGTSRIKAKGNLSRNFKTQQFLDILCADGWNSLYLLLLIHSVSTNKRKKKEKKRKYTHKVLTSHALSKFRA